MTGYCKLSDLISIPTSKPHARVQLRVRTVRLVSKGVKAECLKNSDIPVYLENSDIIRNMRDSFHSLLSQKITNAVSESVFAVMEPG